MHLLATASQPSAVIAVKTIYEEDLEKCILYFSSAVL
jgi:hypothetical protein